MKEISSSHLRFTRIELNFHILHVLKFRMRLVLRIKKMLNFCLKVAKYMVIVNFTVKWRGATKSKNLPQK